MEAVGHPHRELDPGDRPVGHGLGVEDAERRAVDRAVVQEAQDPALALAGVVAVGHEERLVHSEIGLSGGIADCDPALVDEPIGAVRRAPALVVVAICLALDQGVGGTANPDRGEHRRHPVTVRPIAADEAGQGAQSALQQTECGLRNAIVGEAEVRHVEGALRAHGHDAAVLEAKLRAAGFTGAQDVAVLDRRSGRERRFAADAHRDHLARCQQDPTHGLRRRVQARQRQKHAEEPAHHRHTHVIEIHSAP